MTKTGHATRPSGRILKIAGQFLQVDEDSCQLLPQAPASPPAFTSADAFWDVAKTRAPVSAVEIRSVAGISANPLIQLLEQQGVSTTQTSGTQTSGTQTSGELGVILTDDYLHPDVSDFIAGHEFSLLAKPIGRRLWLGPLFIKDQEPCYQCLIRWISLNRYPQNAFAQAEGVLPPQPSIALLPSTEALAAGWIATAVTLVLAGAPPAGLRSCVQHFDTLTGRIERSQLNPWPGCPTCLTRRPSFDSFVSPYLGLVRGLDVTQEPVLGFHHARGRFLQSWPTDPERGFIEPQIAAARGWSTTEAQQSCIAEAVERYSLVYQGTERIITAKLSELELHGLSAIHPNQLLLFSEQQYQARETRNAGVEEELRIPVPFDPTTRIGWIEMKPLLGSESRWIPAQYCLFWYPSAAAQQFCLADSNGCALGPTLDEALLGALCELIERDAVSLWWYNRVRRPAVPAEAFRNANLQRLEAALRSENWQPVLLDLTTEFGVPVFVAVIRNSDTGNITLGSAAHPDPSTAAIKALSEAAQVYCWSTEEKDSQLARWRRKLTFESLPQLVPAGSGPPPPGITGSTETGLATILNRLKGSGYDPYYVDLTRPETGWPVARVIVPGLRHFWPRFAPGRLFDVPVALGWIAAPRREHELEKTPLLL